jgi:pilus assembly protein CpaE
VEKELAWIMDSGTAPKDYGVDEEDVLVLDDPIPDGAKRAAPPPAGLFKPVQKFDVLFITSDAVLRERLSESFAGHSRVNVRHMQGRVVEIEKKISEAELPDCVVVDIGKGDVLDINALERLKKTRFLKVPIVAISSHLHPTIARGLMRAKVDDWLPSNCQPNELQRSCEKVLLGRPAEGTGRHAQCTTLFPANGGCGNTTLAIQTAFLLGARKKNYESVCLVDLNFLDGAVADYLDLTPAFQLSELSKAKRRLDRQMLDVMLTRHRSGLAVLAAPRVPGRFVDVGGELIASVLGLLSEAFSHLVIDLPKNWYPWTDNVIWGSDRIFVVSSFTIPALRQAHLVADAIAAKTAPEAQVSVLVNKFYEPLIGAGLTRKDAETMLTARLGGFIPDLGGVVNDAINRGVTLSEMRAGNKIEKRLAQILDRDDRVAKA